MGATWSFLPSLGTPPSQHLPVPTDPKLPKSSCARVSGEFHLQPPVPSLEHVGWS